MRYFLFLIIAFCSFVTGSHAEEIKIAVCGPFTERDTEIGYMLQRGVSLKIKEINASGGLNGIQVTVVYKDDAADPAEAFRVAGEVAKDKSISAVIGHMHSNCSLAARDVYQQAKLPALSPGSTNVLLCSASPYYFRTIYRNDYQAKFAVRYMDEILGLKNIALLSDNSAYGQELKRHFLTEAKKRHLNVVVQEFYDATTTQNFNSLVKKFRFKTPEIVFVAGFYQHAGLLAKAMEEEKIPIRIMGADALFSGEFIKIGGNSTDKALIITPFVGHATFTQSFKKAYGVKPNATAALSYDAAGLLLQVIAKVGTHREEIRKELASMSSSEQGYQGVTGNTFFDLNGDCLRPAVVAMVSQGKFVAATKQMGTELIKQPSKKTEDVEKIPERVAGPLLEEEKIIPPQEKLLLMGFSANEVLIGIIIVMAIIIMMMVVRKPVK